MSNATPAPKFKTDWNLDDEDEAQEFFDRFCKFTNQSIAEALGFDGAGGDQAAQNLFDYACLKLIACRWRREGDINMACIQEGLLDGLYYDKISPAIDCW